MNFLGKVHGLGIQVAPLTDSQKAAVKTVYEKAYKDFKWWMREDGPLDGDDTHHGKMMMLGRRTSFNGVVERLAGHGDIVDATPYEAVLDALRDGASADYWYTYEKEW